MGLHEAPVSFTQEEVRSKPSVCSGTPSTVKKKKKNQTWREKTQEPQSSPGYWDGGFSSPQDSIFSKPSLLDTKDVKETQKKKNSLFLKETHSSQGKHDLQTMS